MSDCQPPTIEVEQVGLSEVWGLHREVVTLRCPAPRPPGTRLTLRRPGRAEPLAQGKVTFLAVAGTSPDRWELTVKLFSPSQEVRWVLGGG